ncbi:MAG: DNRLRE domain-containing protein [Sorangiineae bacterium]|nr:DNRLRE domain-containing protein [Polyangiaceae bacterium]MEB2324903.1 DNRLRE domain-containing protein [Sorangiineae bacterium]
MRALSISLAASAFVSCAPSVTPCLGASACGAGRECLANRCVAEGGEPVDAATERVVSEPLAMAVVSAAEHHATLPGAVTFGGATGPLALYLRFPALAPRARIAAAFLLLEPAPGGLRGTTDVPVEVWRVTGAWRPGALRWLAQPTLEGPSSPGLARAAPPQTLRIDVTALARASAARPESARGLVVRSRSALPPGASFATGTAGGRAPRLEVYLAR